MKKWLCFILCAVSLAAWAQEPSADGQRPKRDRKPTAEEIEAFKAKRAKAAETADAGQAQVSNGGQEDFDAIMGSFSELALKFSQEEKEDLDLFVYECQHISAETFAKTIEPFLSVNGEISDSEDSDLVVITDEKERIKRLKQIAESIDRPVRQVLVSASVVAFQITDGFEKDISLQYNQFRNLIDESGSASSSTTTYSYDGSDNLVSEVSQALSPAYGGLASGGAVDLAERILSAVVPSGGNPASLSGQSSYVYYDPDEQAIFSAFLTFLDSSGTARILSSPSLIMRRGHTGNILSGEDIPITKSTQNSAGTNYSVDYKSVGIKLRVTPESIFDERVVLEVSPEVSNIIRYEESAAGRNPVIAIRNASTKLEINDGCMVSIGGLLREEQIETKKQVPILGRIPILGILFRASSSEKIRSQLVIFLTVNVVEPGDLSADTIRADEVSDELQKKVDSSIESFPPEKWSLWDGLKKLFR
jgi:YD repeat-containing protein